MGGRGRVKTNCHHVELHRESMGQSHNGQSSDHQHTSALIWFIPTLDYDLREKGENHQPEQHYPVYLWVRLEKAKTNKTFMTVGIKYNVRPNIIF